MDSFSSLVEEHRAKDGVADLFGVILFTDEHPNIKKVLRDDDYWLSLHELTGDRFCVFSVKPEKGSYEFPSFPKGTIGMMVQIWKEPSKNRKLIETFELKDTSNLPLLLLFTEVGGKHLKIELKLNDSSQDNAFNSLRDQLQFSRDSLAKVKEENVKNSEGLFAAVSMHNDHRNQWALLKKGVDIYAYIRALLP
ncbi:hypothetical protein FT643_22620 [Ketobacter sp. MCCC 1A13808]|uniref:hypothetical protein n=1 Tax=Ketobacter sp. MCCC 1A13808 TaxID=2602738 RepID=UPI0012EC4C8F|nr:hypothetical protein [Ketobacter sp. MCCC 1A13808]MVF14932.1 hypothetical protein [Ketobacter sp. MCCC 1A13808]